MLRRPCLMLCCRLASSVLCAAVLHQVPVIEWLEVASWQPKKGVTRRQRVKNGIGWLVGLVSMVNW
jgi:hypothetical protein